VDAKNHWELGRWRGVDVRLHWTVLLSCAWLYLLLNDLLATAIGGVALLLLFIAHELGHVFVARRRRLAVYSIELNGLHGRTEHADGRAADELAIAWGGVAAQCVPLILAFALFWAASGVPWAWVVVGPVFFVWVKLNVFLMLLALLPIGPFDGRAAWQVIPRLRQALRRRGKAKLSAEQVRELEKRSRDEAAELIERLNRKPKAERKDGE
jgi:stage IV sporulation protein FB